MADLLTAQTLIESPIGAKAGILLGGRGVHGLGANLFLRDEFPYEYGDLLGRMDLAVGRDGTLGVTGFWNRESIRLGDSPVGVDEEAVWGNAASSLRYRGPLLGRDAELTLATGTYRARLPIGDDSRVVVDGIARQTRLAADLSGGGTELRIHYGISYERTVMEQRVWAGARGIYQGALRGTTLFAATATGETGGVYADLNWGATPRVRVRGGLRADFFPADASLRFAPRLAVNWAVSERAVLLIAGGRYRQFVRESGEVLPGSEGSEAVHAPRALRLADASHLLVGLDQLLADEIRFGIEGYFKRFEGIPTEIGTGAANASGVDLWLRRGEGRVTGWLGYSLGWVWTAPQSGEATDLFSGRQLLSLGLSGEIGAGGRLGLRVGYGAGIP
jgi:hypothetical protein